MTGDTARGMLAPRRFLPILLILALGLRVAWWALYVDVIENEGVEYTRLARNWFGGDGYVSSFGGTHTLFPPAYPLLIGLTRPFAGSEEAAARLVSLLAGLLLVWAVYRLALELFSPTAAGFAGLLCAAHPLLVALSVSTYSEGLYIGLAAAATFLVVRCVGAPSWPLACGAGVLTGGAYLTRPEGIVLAGPFAVVLLASMWRQGRRRALGYAALLLASTTLVGAPYVARLSALAGAFRWEGKSGVNNLIVSRSRGGLDRMEAGRGLDPDGGPAGAFMFKDQGMLLRSNHASVGAEMQGLVQAPVERSWQAARSILQAGYLGAPLIVILALVGLGLTGWWRGRFAGFAVLLILPAVTFLVLWTVEWVWSRYLFALLPALLVWSAGGLERIGRFSRAAAVALALLVLATSARDLTGVAELAQTRDVDVRAAGEWMRRDYPGPDTSLARPLVVGIRLALAHYAGGEMIYLPAAPETLALKFIHRVAPDYLVIRQSEAKSTPYGAKWLSGDVADACAQAVHLPEPAATHYRIWRWACRE